MGTAALARGLSRSSLTPIRAGHLTLGGTRSCAHKAHIGIAASEASMSRRSRMVEFSAVLRNRAGDQGSRGTVARASPRDSPPVSRKPSELRTGHGPTSARIGRALPAPGSDRDIFTDIFMPTTVHIPDPLLKSVDRRAKALGISHNRLVIRALEQAVSVREGWSPEFLQRLRQVDRETSTTVDELLATVTQARRSKKPRER